MGSFILWYLDDDIKQSLEPRPKRMKYENGNEGKILISAFLYCSGRNKFLKVYLIQ